MKKLLKVLLTCTFALSMVGCSSTTEEEETSDLEGTILVAAAASLKNAYEDELIPLFESQYENVTVEGTYDSSGKLQTQIEEGLEADVFMSAATTQMDALDEEGLIMSDTIVNLLENKIVLITPTDSTLELSEFTDIVNAESIALGDPESVPAGQYAQEALTNLGIWDEIQDKVSFGTNVTEVLNQVAAASADAGIVYATDAASMPDDVVVVAEAPEDSLSAPVIYPVAVVGTTANEEIAKAFVEFLQSDEAIAIFEEYGFTSNI
ncbi:MAG: molybdate ABC transporter substrate-binding protein [Erysipelotrichaceae bacterium]|nr:molybdate ABC transporter substrate-binding protein [Erysipelotrichaceae bacterium]